MVVVPSVNVARKGIIIGFTINHGLGGFLT
jgi:hypothetical protein